MHSNFRCNGKKSFQIFKAEILGQFSGPLNVQAENRQSVSGLQRIPLLKRNLLLVCKFWIENLVFSVPSQSELLLDSGEHFLLLCGLAFTHTRCVPGF